MKNSATYTSSIPVELFRKLNEYAEKFKMPKNKLIEKALKAYFEQIKKAEYARSFEYASRDEEMKTLAEEGIEDYLKILGDK